MTRTTIFFIFGGESAEHRVSLDSARYIFTLLKPERYDIALCYVDTAGIWWKVESFAQIDDERFEVTYTPRLGTGAITASDGTTIHADALLPILLGSNGEDGAIQGVAQMLHVPVVGSGILGSAICMDKEVTKRLLLQANIAVAEYLLYCKGDSNLSYAAAKEVLGGTIFIKPACQGSSIGVMKATNEAEFDTGLSNALSYDHKILLERAVDGVEVGCGIIGNSTPEASAVSLIDVGDNAFFTYDAKYSRSSSASTQIPANLSADVTEAIKHTAIKAYQVLMCSGYTRIDMFLTNDGRILVNELNTLPAFRDDSSFPKLWKALGVKPNVLWDKIIDYALESTT
ncbi:D-alanine--D-alanine ligase [Aeromicrobium sp.]|nr:D-alanine--D-alanine ligase [Candidatus Saccharibacteria bacterium]